MKAQIAAAVVQCIGMAVGTFWSWRGLERSSAGVPNWRKGVNVAAAAAITCSSAVVFVYLTALLVGLVTEETGGLIVKWFVVGLRTSALAVVCSIFAKGHTRIAAVIGGLCAWWFWAEFAKGF